MKILVVTTMLPQDCNKRESTPDAHTYPMPPRRSLVSSIQLEPKDSVRASRHSLPCVRLSSTRHAAPLARTRDDNENEFSRTRDFAGVLDV